MSTRYAVIVTQDDGTEIISNIHMMEGGKPDVRSNARIEKVGDDVQIGMIRGGGGKKFAFPEGSTQVRSPVGKQAAA